MNEHRIEVLIGSPAIFNLLLKFRMDRDCLSTLRVCASAGGPIARETASEIRERFGIAVRQAYGMSEIGIIAVEPVEGGPPAVPISTVSIRVLDESCRPLPIGEKGEIAVKGTSEAKGYIIESADTEEFFSDGYYRTGDAGYLDSTGNLNLLERIRAVINISGTKVDPTEIENTLRGMPEVRDCRVVGESVGGRSEVIKAIIAVREGEVLRREDIISYCRSQLAEYKIPRIIEFSMALPSDLTGKAL
jgi:long-chain acyl-CoA synthetase